MNKILSSILISSTILIAASCDSQLDIVPKGQTTLDRTADLELLLNQEYNLGDFPYENLAQICGESVGMGTSIPEMMSNTQRQGEHDRAQLRASAGSQRRQGENRHHASANRR